MPEDNVSQPTSQSPANTETEDKTPWYAIRLFSNCQNKVDEFFKEHGVESFIPMQYRVYEDENGKPKRKLKPVVSNLIFVKKSLPQAEMMTLVAKGQFKMSVITKDRSSRDYYEIPAKQMMEFKAMCNPEIEMRKYLSAEQAKLKLGTPVLVCHGPLKGLTGRLVRQSHKYYLLKEVPGMGVMLKVSRWCCQPLEESK
ncbi:MAG: UpxY family transcription antiterminator [Prevotella sp.]|nr:UpxY family transcription antiterminator [Prevotella sp.]